MFTCQFLYKLQLLKHIHLSTDISTFTWLRFPQNVRRHVLGGKHDHASSIIRSERRKGGGVRVKGWLMI